MSKFDIWPEFECQNRISNVKMRYSAHNSNVEKRKTKSEKRKTKFEKLKIRYSVQVRMSK